MPDHLPPPADLPGDVRAAASLVRRLSELPERTPRETAELNQARLKIAYYACRREKVPAIWENLSYILGSHAEEIRPAFERALAQRREAGEDLPAIWAGSDTPDNFWQTQRRDSGRLAARKSGDSGRHAARPSGESGRHRSRPWGGT